MHNAENVGDLTLASGGITSVEMTFERLDRLPYHQSLG